MAHTLYILLLVVLTFFGAFSLHNNEYKTAALLILFWNIVIFTMLETIYGISASGDLLGIFFVAIIGISMTFIFLVFYQTEQSKILLKLAAITSLVSGANLLCIMTYKPMRDISWYYAPIFDNFYSYYAELQIVLTLYMISLFWKSGIMGLSNGLDKIFRPITAGKYTHRIHNFHGGVVNNGDHHCKENKIHKKGI